MHDPTYVPEAIQANPIWRLAFRLSEFDNDGAPIGWSRYIPMAEWLLVNFDMTERDGKTPAASPARQEEQ